MFSKIQTEENYSDQRIVYRQNLVQVPKERLQEIQFRCNVAITFKNKNKQAMAGSGVMISKDLVLTAAHNLYDKLYNEHHDNVRVYASPNNIAEQYFEVQSWRFPQQFKTVNNNMKRLRYDYAIIKLKPNPKLELKYDSFLYLSHPCPECLNANKKQTILLLTGFPLNYGDNYKNLDLLAGKKIILNQYGQCGTDMIVDINSSKCKISYTISTEAALSGCPVIVDNSIIGIHCGSEDNKDSNIGRLMDDEMICNIRQWSRQLDSQGIINTNTLYQQSCQHKINQNEDLFEERACDLSKEQEAPVIMPQHLPQNNVQILYVVPEQQQNQLQEEEQKYNEFHPFNKDINKSELIIDNSDIDNQTFLQLTYELEQNMQAQQLNHPNNNEQFIMNEILLEHAQRRSSPRVTSQNYKIDIEKQSKNESQCMNKDIILSQQKKNSGQQGSQMREKQVSNNNRQEQQQQQENQDNSSLIFAASSIINNQSIIQKKEASLIKRVPQPQLFFKIVYQNKEHRKAIKRVSQRNLKYIAQHDYFKSQNYFYVKYGFDYKQWQKLLCEDPSLVAKLIEDMCEAITNLKELGIDHMDLAQRNIVLFIEDLRQKKFIYHHFDFKEIMKETCRFRFKFIDFGYVCCYKDSKEWEQKVKIVRYQQFLEKMRNKFSKEEKYSKINLKIKQYESLNQYKKRIIGQLQDDGH